MRLKKNSEIIGEKSIIYRKKDRNNESDFELDEEEEEQVLNTKEKQKRKEQSILEDRNGNRTHLSHVSIDFDEEEEIQFDDDKATDNFDNKDTNNSDEEEDKDENDDSFQEEENTVDGKKKSKKGPSQRELDRERFLKRLNRKRNKFDAQLKPMLSALKSSLGTYVGKVFYHSATCIRELQRLKETIEEDASQDRLIWKHLAEWKLLQNELVSIVAYNRRYSSDNEELLFAAVNLMVTMTQPPKRLPDSEIKRVSKKDEMFNLKTQYRILQEMKLSFLLKNSVASLMETLLPSDESVQENNFLLETKQSSSLLSYEEYTMLVIQLFVNLLKVPDAKPNVLAADDQISQMQEMLLKQMDQTRMLKFMNAVIQKLFIKYDAKFNKSNYTRQKVIEWYFLCLQFISLVILEETPESLFEADRSLSLLRTTSSNSQNTASYTIPKANDYDKEILKKLLETEEEQQDLRMATVSSRHSRFGGYFVSHFPKATVTSNVLQLEEEETTYNEVMKQVQPNTVKVIRQPYATQVPVVEQDNVKQRQICVRVRLREPHFSRLSTQSKKILKDFLYVFYKHSFNMFFERIWESIVYQRESILNQESAENANNEANFLFLGAFMLNFNLQNHYHHIELNKRVSAVYTRPVTFDVSSIASIIELPELVQYVLDRIINFAYATKDWDTLTQTSYFLKEYVVCLEIMFNQIGNKADYTRIASTLLHKILYEPKRTELIPKMFCIFEPVHFPRNYMVNLVELSRVFIEIITRNKEFETFYTKKKRKKNTEAASESDIEDNAIKVDDDKDNQYNMHQQFDIDRFKKKFAHSSTVRALLLLLEDYAINEPNINSYTVDMLEMIAKDCECQLFLFNVSTLIFFSKVVSKKGDLYPQDKPEFLMSEREKINKKMVDFMLKLVYNWRTMLIGDIVFGKYIHVEAWFLKTKKGLAILKGEEIDTEEEVYSDSERRRRRRNTRKQGLSSAAFSDNEDIYPTSAGEDHLPRVISMARSVDLDNILGGRNTISMTDGEEEYEFESQDQRNFQEEYSSQEEEPSQLKNTKRSRSKSPSERNEDSARSNTSDEERTSTAQKVAKRRRKVPATNVV